MIAAAAAQMAAQTIAPQENAAAAEIQLTAEELREIDALLPPGIAAGTRYAEGGMRAVNR